MSTGQIPLKVVNHGRATCQSQTGPDFTVNFSPSCSPFRFCQERQAQRGRVCLRQRLRLVVVVGGRVGVLRGGCVGVLCA